VDDFTHVEGCPLAPPDLGEGEEVSLHATMDAWIWAREFMRIVQTENLTVDEELMLVWFANAIMVGYDAARARIREDAARAEEEG